MGLKERLRKKMHLDTLHRKVLYTIKDGPEGGRWVDKELTGEILDRTDFEHKKSGNIDLYTRPLQGDDMEILVLDNELPIYHTTVADVVLRKNPHWQQVFSIRNIRKIMNDQDVLVSRGKESLQRLYADALGRLDLTYTRADLVPLIGEGGQGLERGSVEEVWESLNLFFELVDFQPVYFEPLEAGLHLFGRPAPGRDEFQDLLIFNERAPSLGLKKGVFPTKTGLDNAWLLRCAKGVEPADLEGVAVFEHLADLALEKAHPIPPMPGELLDELPLI